MNVPNVPQCLLGQYNKAIEYFEKALASDLKTFGPDHPTVAIGWNNLGIAWNSLGQYDKAIEYYEKALKILRNALGEDHPYTKSVKNKLQNLQSLLNKERDQTLIK